MATKPKSPKKAPADKSEKNEELREEDLKRVSGGIIHPLKAD
jgi:hypothetical protein